MPSPIIAHVILTMALLGAFILTAALAASIYFVQSLTNVEVALCEVAESVARDIVKLVSAHASSNAYCTCIELVLPPTLAGYAYEIEIIGEGRYIEGRGNLQVEVRLQHYRQKRVRITLNLERGVVHPGQGGEWYGMISNTLLVPLPPGAKPILIACGGGGGVTVVGFTTRLPFVCVLGITY